MTYTYRQIEDTFVVWYGPANRFMQLQEPAFRILEDWVHQFSESQIIRNCALQFELTLDEAQRFVREVTGKLQSLVCPMMDDKMASDALQALPLPDQEVFSTKYYRINGKYFRFRYSDPGLEGLIHPGFCYLEHQAPEGEADHCFDLFFSGDQVFLQTDGSSTRQCPDSKPEQFVGLVNIQLLNCIHHAADADWMGAVHASAVTAGKGAVLFTAPSGSGKSTFAAMLMNQGYRVLSDDFSPISINQSKVFPFPEGISVKNRSLKALQAYFPSLATTGNGLPPDVREVFLPIANDTLPEASPVKAIVFLQYHPEVEVEFKKISNLEAMDRFLQQLWLPPTAQVASTFMDWYFQIPCYTLNYSDNTKAIETISNLFER